MGLLSLFFNVVLLYLINRHSSFASRVYTVMLTIDASLDLILSVFVLFGQPVCLVGDGYKLYFSDGYFAGHSDFLDQFLVFGWALVTYFNIMWVAIQFVYRYAYVCLQNEHSKARRVLGWTAAVSFIWAVVGIAYCIDMYFVREPEGLRVLQLNQWDTSRYAPVVTGGSVSSWRITAWIALWVVTCIGSAIIVIVFEIKIGRDLKSTGTITHNATKRMHSEFHRALLAMAICPLVTCSVPVLFIMSISITGSNPGINQVFLTMATSAITVFNPLTTMFFMRSYRAVIVKKLCRRKVADLPVNTRITGISFAATTQA